MKILVTGGAGFVARHLTAELSSAGYEVWLSDCLNGEFSNYLKADLTDVESIYDLVTSVRPEAVVHLGAVSFVPDAENNKRILERVNVDGTRNLIEAFMSIDPFCRRQDSPAFVFVSTAQVYQRSLSAYALSKLTGEALVVQYCRKGLNGVIVRPANHTGPGQSEKFVLPSFVRQALDIKAGKRQCFKVGNLDSVRDFTDVRDVVRAYRLVLEKGESGNVYPIGSSVRYTMRELLEKVATTVGVSADYEVDKALWRPTDETPALNSERLRMLGWQPQISIDRTISEIIEGMRNDTY